MKVFKNWNTEMQKNISENSESETEKIIEEKTKQKNTDKKEDKIEEKKIKENMINITNANKVKESIGFIYNEKILLAYSIGALILVYPIFNSPHFSVSVIPSIILVFYTLGYALAEIMEDKKIERIIGIVNLVAGLLIIIYSIFSILNLYVKGYKNENYNNYYFYNEGIFNGAIIKKSTKEKIDNIEKYLIEKKKEGKNIIVISNYAMFNTLNLNIDNYFFDMPLTGNFGKDGVNKMIEKINSSDSNTLILINNDEVKEKIYQYPEEFSEFVKNNYKKVDTIEYYDVYEK